MNNTVGLIFDFYFLNKVNLSLKAEHVKEKKEKKRKQNANAKRNINSYPNTHQIKQLIIFMTRWPKAKSCNKTRNNNRKKNEINKCK